MRCIADRVGCSLWKQLTIPNSDWDDAGDWSFSLGKHCSRGDLWPCALWRCAERTVLPLWLPATPGWHQLCQVIQGTMQLGIPYSGMTLGNLTAGSGLYLRTGRKLGNFPVKKSWWEISLKLPLCFCIYICELLDYERCGQLCRRKCGAQSGNAGKFPRTWE